MKNNKPAIKEKYTVKVKGVDTVTYPGKLDYGHQQGIKKLCTEIVQFPNKDNDNTAICMALVETEDGRIFSDIGDASPSNVPSGCVQSYIRIASTRAKSRALGDAYNIGALGEEDIVVAENTQIIDVTPVVDPAPSKQLSAGGGDKPISSGQIKYIEGLCGNRGEDPEELARTKWGRPLSELLGKEADQLIKSLQAPF